MVIQFSPKDILEHMTEIKKADLELFLPSLVVETNRSFFGWRLTDWKVGAEEGIFTEHDQMFVTVHKGRTVSFIVDTRYWHLNDAPVTMVFGSNGALVDILVRTTFEHLSGIIPGMLYLYMIWRRDGSPSEYTVSSHENSPAVHSVKVAYKQIQNICIKLSVPEFEGDIVLIGKPITKLKLV